MNSDNALARRKLGGFSLIELMIVISVLAILLGIGVPSFRELIASQKARAAASALHDSLLLARSEAIKRNSTVTLSVNSSNLANGWSVLLSDGTTSIRTQEAFSELTFSPSAPSLGYSPLGRLNSGTLTTVTISGTGSTKQWTIRAEASGRVCVVEGGTSC